MLPLFPNRINKIKTIALHFVLKSISFCGRGGGDGSDCSKCGVSGNVIVKRNSSPKNIRKNRQKIKLAVFSTDITVFLFDSFFFIAKSKPDL